jgi:hypothetical protein
MVLADSIRDQFFAAKLFQGLFLQEFDSEGSKSPNGYTNAYAVI